MAVALAEVAGAAVVDRGDPRDGDASSSRQRHPGSSTEAMFRTSASKTAPCGPIITYALSPAVKHGVAPRRVLKLGRVGPLVATT